MRPRRSGAPWSDRTQRFGLVLGDRGERDGDVAEELRVDAAEADEGDRPEAHVAAHADDQLDALAERRHALDRVRDR